MPPKNKKECLIKNIDEIRSYILTKQNESAPPKDVQDLLAIRESMKNEFEKMLEDIYRAYATFDETISVLLEPPQSSTKTI